MSTIAQHLPRVLAVAPTPPRTMPPVPPVAAHEGTRGTLTARPSDLHTRMSTVAAAFVFLALLALSASPLVTFHRLNALRTVAAETTVAASQDLSELRLLFTEEVVLHQTMRSGTDSTARTRYVATRAREETLMAQLQQLAPRLGASVPPHVDAVRRVARRWHDAADARATGRMSERRFAAELPRLHELHDATLAAHALLAADVQRLDTQADAVGAQTIRRQGDISLALGGLAAMAALAVGGFVRRERRLAHALARAVDEESRLRTEAESRREELLRISESKARLVRGFTHDVKNPIGAADGYLQLLEDGIPEPATVAQRRSIERARRSLKAALHLIGDLLEVAHAESGTIEVQAVPTDLAAVARDAAEEYRAQAEAKGLQLEISLDERVPLLTTDPVRVRQVLGNLISNAVKYTDRGRVQVRLLGARLGRGTDVSDRYAIEVTDTGPGIAPDQQRRLFEEFVRLDPAAAPGVGLGLAISRRIARALGGDLAVRSDAGHGSTFVLWLPTA